MVTLTFVFDKDKLEKTGQSEDELLQPMRNHAKKYQIDEKEYGVFSKDGEDALCVLSMFIPDIVDKNPKYISFLKEWTLNVDGEEEDCIHETYEWFREYKPQIMLE